MRNGKKESIHNHTRMSASFLVLGAKGCRYCSQSVMLLEDNEMRFIYLNLEQLFPSGEWRDVFSYLSEDLINGQRKIPLIFKYTGQLLAISTGEELREACSRDGVEFIGGFQELEAFLDTIDLSDNY